MLAADHVHSWLRDLPTAKHWQSALPILLEDFQQLLRDALDLLRELDEADEHDDRSHWDQPSISPHRQNRGFHDWTALIELLRDSWLATRANDPERATRIAEEWFRLRYPTFKRLALFAASQDGCIPADQWVDWLGADGAEWLWSNNTRRETMRLLVRQGAQLAPAVRERLEATILGGPPRALYRDDLEIDSWNQIVDHSIWLRLVKLKEGGGRLGDAALRRFEALSAAHSEWQPQSDESDEFALWVSEPGDLDFEGGRVIAPRKRRDLVNWLQQHPSLPRRPFQDDTWRQTCRKHLLNSLYALCDLAQEDIWPPERWREALQTWSEEDRLLRSWRFAAPLVQTMPDDVFREIAHAVTGWLRHVSESIDRHEEIFYELCRRVLALPHSDGVDTDQPVNRALNHPIGHVTDALLNLCFKGEPNDNDNLPAEIAPFFARLCDTRVEPFRHGRVLLASRLIALFRLDRSWTEEHLLPLFDWTNPVEAGAAWQGFLWSPRLYRPLLITFKTQFLATAHHYAELGEHGDQYAALLTYAALDPVEGYSSEDFRSAIAALPREGLQEVAQALAQALEGAGEQRVEYWKNRVQPFWQQVWPKHQDLMTKDIAQSLARVAIEADGEFPSALSAVLDWLQPLECLGVVVDRLHEFGLTARFPGDALRLLDRLINDQSWVPHELGQCLTAIAEAAPSLKQDTRYQRLKQLSRRSGN